VARAPRIPTPRFHQVGRVETATMRVYDGGVETYEREVFPCRVAPVRTVTDEDLYALHSQWRSFLPPNRTSYAEPLDEAWNQLVGRLLGDEVLPNRVLNTWRLRTVHLYMAAHLICLDFATGEARDGKWMRLAETYEKKVETLYNALTVKRDDDEDGVADGDGSAAAEPELWLGAVPWRGWP
jgi:hypothetical protein